MLLLKKSKGLSNFFMWLEIGMGGMGGVGGMLWYKREKKNSIKFHRNIFLHAHIYSFLNVEVCVGGCMIALLFVMY